MKKLYTFLAVTAFTAIAANAQSANLVENGGFEIWTSDTQPANFAPLATPSINNFFTKEATIKHGGNFSAKHQSQSGAQYVEASTLIPVVAGDEYTISYWYLDNDTSAKSRIWSGWMQQSGTTYTQLADNSDILRFDDQAGTSYSTNSPEWVNKVIKLKAPASATHFRYQVRTYRESTTAQGGYVYYDDFSLVDNNATAGVKQDEITNLKLFPNPLTGNVLNIVTNSGVEKSVAVFDVLGKQVINAKTVNGTVNAANLTAGVYVVKITEEGKTATRKLIVQ